MPTSVFLGETAGIHSANGVLEETVVTVEDIRDQAPRVRRIEVAFTLNTPDASFIHMYQFFTDDVDEDDRSSWDEFVELITVAGDNEQDSLIYIARRNGGVMSEFTFLCLEDKQCSATA